MPTTPDWVKHAVFYQIFPDRFARSGQVVAHTTVSLKPWGHPPEQQGFQGGDLYGIIQHLDYLQDLGITALYLNPIFASAANHRYHTYDYYTVDPLLGGNDALHDLLDAAHRRDMRVVLDGVFNHASRGFWPFHHVLENGLDSPYADWFHLNGEPLRPYSSEDKPANYEGWAGLRALPTLNTDHPPVRDFLFDVATHWVEQGIDGWRLDVPGEIDDPDFWRTFRTRVKAVNPEAYLCGEIWTHADRWLQGDQFDGVMNYPLVDALFGFVAHDTIRGFDHRHFDFAPRTGNQFADAVMDTLMRYPESIRQAQLNLLDSHDTPRALHTLGGSIPALRMAVLFQMTMPGAPCIYYGDEIGLASAGDPHCREAFPWHDDTVRHTELLAFYQQATALRHAYPVLRTGRVEVLRATDRQVVFRRQTAEREALVAFNTADTLATLTVPAPSLNHATYQPVWPPDRTAGLHASDPTVQLPERSTAVWMSPASTT